MTSKSEPVAISVNLAKSAREDRELPSAKFEDTETAALRICIASPNISLRGKTACFGVNEIRKINGSMPSV